MADKRVSGRGARRHLPSKGLCIEDRILRLSQPDPSTGCLVWVGSCDTTGYGQMSIDGRHRQAHRVAYEAVYGPLADGMVCDHLCRNRKCVNPEHIEAVTRSENNARGLLSALRTPSSKCRNGHPLLDAFARTNPRNGRPMRICRTCRQASQAAYEAASQRKRGTTEGT